MTTKNEKAELRERLEKDIEAFLKDGGRIKNIPAGLSAQEAKYYTTKGGVPRSKDNRMVWREFDAYGNPTKKKEF
jgi:hypothetical protein